MQKRSKKLPKRAGEPKRVRVSECPLFALINYSLLSFCLNFLFFTHFITKLNIHYRFEKSFHINFVYENSRLAFHFFPPQ
jgi:hypothetical protein